MIKTKTNFNDFFFALRALVSRIYNRLSDILLYQKITLIRQEIKFLGLIVRCKNEPYVCEFVSYYLAQGIDKIYILDDNSDVKIYKDVASKVEVIILPDFFKGSKNSQRLKIATMNRKVNSFYKRIKSAFEWIIYVDMDEYITTKKNMHMTIREELQNTFKDSSCVKIPWVMMACNSIKSNPRSLLRTNIYRWNHDVRHENNRSYENKFRCRYDTIEVKCIFKPRFFAGIYDHYPVNQNCKDISVVESIRNTKRKLDGFHEKLREIDISDGFLLCYHYRLVSIENCLDKIKNNVWHQKFNLEDLLSNDYPELMDETLKNKSVRETADNLYFN